MLKLLLTTIALATASVASAQSGTYAVEPGLLAAAASPSTNTFATKISSMFQYFPK